MNYSDFEKIEQDEWSLTRPTFPTPKGGTLTVVGWSGRKAVNYDKCYIVECNICKNDNELNGDGIYQAVKSHLSRGVVPCGCSKHPKYTKYQWEVRVKRSAENKGLKFISFLGEFKGKNTKLKLCCPEHGSWIAPSADGLLHDSCGCPLCGRLRTTEASTKGYKDHVAEFMESKKFHKGTQFWKSERKNSRGYSPYWFYKCPACSKDEYATIGLCNGIFEATLGDLKAGKLACRCSKSPQYTEAQWTWRMEKETKENRHTFIRWVVSKGKVKKFQYLCPLHGVQEATTGHYLSGKGCPICSGKNQQQCYVNQVLDEDLVVAIKFGISRGANLRIRGQNSSNLFKMRQIGIWEFPSVESCKAAEKQCKKDLECGVLTKRELADGHTETTHIKNLDRIIEIYENYGGKRINTDEER